MTVQVKCPIMLQKVYAFFDNDCVLTITHTNACALAQALSSLQVNIDRDHKQY